MNYPVKKSDLDDNIATDDEQACLVVVEAIMSDTLNDLELSGNKTHAQLKDAVLNWDQFEAYSRIISNQKALFERSISAVNKLDMATSLDDGVEDDLSRIKNSVVELTIKKSVYRRRYARLSLLAGVASVALVISLGSTIFTSSQTSNSRVSTQDLTIKESVQRVKSSSDQGQITPTKEELKPAESNDTLKVGVYIGLIGLLAGASAFSYIRFRHYRAAD